MRKPSDNDFFIELDGVGTFRYGRRNYGDRIRIRAEFLRLTKGLEIDDDDLTTTAAIVAAHKVLCVEAPPGWEDLETIDMIDNPEAEEKVVELFLLLREKEDSFRKGTSQVSTEARP